MARSFGSQNIPGLSLGIGKPPQPDDAIGLLQSIDRSAAALANEYVTQSLWQPTVITAMADAATSAPMLCNGVEVGRLIVQVTTANTLLGIYLGSNPGSTAAPLWVIGVTPAPVVIPLPNLITDITVKNVSGNGNAINASVVLSSAAG